MRLIYGHTDSVAEWVSQRIEGCERGFGECQAIGIEHGGRIVAGVVWHNWTPETGVIEATVAAEDRRWATRSNLAELLSYPYRELGCRFVLARTSEDNESALKLWRALGAREYVIPDLRADGEAEVITTLRASDWKKSRLYNGQK